MRASLTAAPAPGWPVLMFAGALVLVGALWIARRFAPESAPIAERVRYSIQLISFRRASSMTPFARREGLLGQARTLDRDRSSGHPVLIGDFERRDEAEAALARWPDRLRDLKAIIRDIAPDERLAPLR